MNSVPVRSFNAAQRYALLLSRRSWGLIGGTELSWVSLRVNLLSQRQNWVLLGGIQNCWEWWMEWEMSCEPKYILPPSFSQPYLDFYNEKSFNFAYHFLSSDAWRGPPADIDKPPFSSPHELPLRPLWPLRNVPISVGCGASCTPQRQ